MAFPVSCREDALKKKKVLSKETLANPSVILKLGPSNGNFLKSRLNSETGVNCD